MKFKLRLVKNGQVLVSVSHAGYSFIVAVYDFKEKRQVGLSRTMSTLDVVKVYEKDKSIGQRVILTESSGPKPYEDVFGSCRIKYVEFTRKLLEFAERKLDK